MSKLLACNDLQRCKILKIDEMDHHKCLFLLNLHLKVVLRIENDYI